MSSLCSADDFLLSGDSCSGKALDPTESCGAGVKPGSYLIKVKISVGGESAARQVELIVKRSLR